VNADKPEKPDKTDALSLTETIGQRYAPVHNGVYASNLLRKLIVKGSINTEQHCPNPKCGDKFLQEHVDEDGFFCPKCLTRPTRYFINGRKFGLPYIYSDIKTGKVFKTYSDAIDLLIEMNRAFKEAAEDKKKFKEDWLPEKITEKRIENIIAARLKDYEDTLEKIAISKSRVNNVENACRFILESFKGKNIREIGDKDVDNFYKSLLKRKYSFKYIDGILKELKSLFKKHRKADDIPAFPEYTIIPKREKQRLGLTREFAVLEKVPDRHGYRVGILLLIRTGMHIDELPAIRKGDCVDGYVTVNKAFTEGRVRLSTKTNSEVDYRLSPEVWDMLMEHCRNKQDEDFVFTYDSIHKLMAGENIPAARWYKIWVKACKDAGVRPISLQQASRHSTASRIMARKKKEAFQEIAEQLGHSNLTTGKKHYIIEGRGN
jgi:integrase